MLSESAKDFDIAGLLLHPRFHRANVCTRTTLEEHRHCRGTQACKVGWAGGPHTGGALAHLGPKADATDLLRCLCAAYHT